MKRLSPEKLHVTYSTGAGPGVLLFPRRYMLIHSDITGELFITIGAQYDTKQISRLYTRLMRDEVLSELTNDELLCFRVHCHVSGGLVIGTARWRYNIFKSELPLAIEAIRYGDRALFEKNPELDNIPVIMYFRSSSRSFNQVENRGTMAEYS